MCKAHRQSDTYKTAKIFSSPQAMTPVLGDPNVTAFLKALSLHQFCSTCTPTSCQLHMAENSFTLTTYVSPFKANTSANWNAVSRRYGADVTLLSTVAT